LAQVGKPVLLQVPFTLCAVLAQIPNIDLRRVEGRLEDVGYEKFDLERLRRRITVAGNWVRKYGPEHLKFTLLGNPCEVSGKLSLQQKHGLRVLAENLDKRWTPENFHKFIYQTARDIKVEPNNLFEAIYLSLINKKKGPKAAALILALDRDFVKERFTSL
ncbi:MAG: hypothetical protein V1703_04335, partial [Candidatus Altiarchaeota archaeon]